jgi:hypothetical protein
MEVSIQNTRAARVPRRGLTWLAAGVLVAIVVLDTVLWWAATRQIEAAAPGVAEMAARAGWLIESGAPTRGGWPFAATVQFPAVKAMRPLGGTTIRWTAPSVAITLRPWAPRVLLVAATGTQTFSLGEAAPLAVQAGVAEVRVPLAGGPSVFAFRDVAIGPENGRPGHDGVRVAHLTGEVEALAAGFTADGVAISPALQPPFDGPLAVSGGLHLTSGFPDAATPQASALAWREAGGRAEVPAMTLRWGPLVIAGSAQGGLDAQLQPQGQMRLQVTGAAQVLDAAGRAGLLAPGPAAAARAVLSLLALAAHGGPVPIPISLADRTLTVGQFPLLRLPLLDWNLP